MHPGHGSQDVTICFASSNLQFRNEDSNEDSNVTCFDAATEHICIGPCILHWSQAAKLELGVLKALHIEIETRNRLPVSLFNLFNSTSPTKSKSWSGLVEGTARCVAAFQSATDATEHSQCEEIVDKLRAHTTALAQRTSPYLRETFGKLLFEYIQNRTYDLAVKNILNKSFEEDHKSFWSLENLVRQRSECLDLLQILANALSDHARTLRDEMDTLRLT